MRKMNLDKQTVVKAAAELTDEIGLNDLSLKLLAEKLGVRSPSLYNHIGSLAELKTELMLYGWRQLEDELIRAAAGEKGFDAVRLMSRAFFEFAMNNKGVFEAMLWYNKYDDETSDEATKGLFELIYKVLAAENISRERAEHLIRTLRGFLEGFSLLVIKDSFGHPADIYESFEISLDVIIEGMKATNRGA